MSTGAWRLSANEGAWNMDGSTSDRLEGISWIRHWEAETGQERDRCSYAGCRRRFEVGGHIWIRRRGVFIAPICSPCNFPANANRMQGSNSHLRSGIVVVRAEYTQDMENARRRTAVAAEEEEEQRSCQGCGEDISDRPENHDLCLTCFRRPQQQQQVTRSRPRQCRRECHGCGQDISDRPPSHSQCLRCFRQPDHTRGGRQSSQLRCRQGRQWQVEIDDYDSDLGDFDSDSGDSDCY